MCVVATLSAIQPSPSPPNVLNWLLKTRQGVGWLFEWWLLLWAQGLLLLLMLLLELLLLLLLLLDILRWE